jgi:hypothetical protein
MAAVFTVWNKEDSAKPCVGVSADDPEVWSGGGLEMGHGDMGILGLDRKEVSGHGRDWYATSCTAGMFAAVLRAPRTLRRRRW